ncbi:tyrosine-type recombinase/integrase [Gordonia humi]|uniref:Integrase n=1 Tax=Gordonia humi TaxID=686429 RepID=A0A840EWH8_9ACTN|nr:site-specific integrase [Gordonia humi]MBB4134653.1 integrase [Gordonia humi]
MPRPPLDIGTYGKITRTQLDETTWQAETRYRDHDGTTRKVRARGTTGAKAEAALKKKLVDRNHQAGGDTLTLDSTIGDLCALWLQDVDASGRAQATKDYYRRIVDRTILPGLNEVRLREATTGRIDRFLRAIPKPSTARDARVALKQAFALAARYDAPPSNPVTDAYRPPASRKKPKALTLDDIQTLRLRTLQWQNEQHAGPKRAYDLAEFIDVMIGTGARIGEVLALRWEDIDFENRTVTIAGTITAQGDRQPHTKTDAGHRTVTVPAFTVDALERQKARGIPYDLVFPTRNGTPRWPANVRTNWRKIRGDNYEWVTPHTLRRTVATLIEREADADTAAKQLGHTSADITRRHYIERAHQAPDSSAILERLAPIRPGENAQ